MNDQSRIFDFLYYQLSNFPKTDMLSGKVHGSYIPISTAEVEEKAKRLGAGLMKMGLHGHDMTVEQQDKIAIISKNRPEWLILDLAVQQTGALLCPIYPTTNVGEMEYIFNDASIKYVFVTGSDILDKVNIIRHNVPSLLGVYSFDKMEGVNHWETIMDAADEGAIKNLERNRDAIRAEHCATIIYTSGTTGKPKGVMLSHRNLVSNVLNSVKSFPFKDRPDGRALSFLPLNHIFERMVSCIYIYTGISIYYAESLETIGDNLKEVKPTLFTTVPRLLEKVYEKIMSKGSELGGLKKKLFYWAVDLAKDYDNLQKGSLGYRMQLALANKVIFNKWREALGGNVEMIVTGGAACQVRLIRIFSAAGIPIFEGYGPTENSPVISVNCNYEGGTKFGTVGPPIQGQEVKLQPDGEICVKGPSVMMGYYKLPDLTSEAIIDGWLHTGDIGVFEDGKYLKITDRKKEMFKTSGGKYVAPQPIENKMKESPYVEQLIIVGADKKFVGALIVPSFSNLREWMQQEGIAFTNIDDAIRNPKVLAFYRDLIESFNKYFNHVEQIKKFELLPNEWSVDTGEMTPKLSLKRKIIMEKYREAVDRIYA
ncbi:MAG: long-chain fatty acid--CoA ligase [Chitinophagaceae bacterium]|nr:MAG: long-chain fatty acid--CoA ligase [Chitinophagaceae bacterium]